jgi:hypothetical protein
MGACPAKGSAPNPKYENGAYDWRYGGIRPQDNANMALYPQIAEYITESVNKTGKKVVVRGCSGGTINGYAFIMSQVCLFSSGMYTPHRFALVLGTNAPPRTGGR